MRKILFILALFVACSTSAQIPFLLVGGSATSAETPPPVTPTGDYANILVAEHTSSNVRLDQATAFRLQSGKILLMYNVFATDPVDNAASRLGYKTSDDGGATWSAQTLLPQLYQAAQCPSIAQRADGTVVVVFVLKTALNAAAPRSYITYFTMPADLSSYSGLTAISPNNNLDYWSPKQDAIFKMPNGDWLYPVGKLLSGAAGSGTYEGRLFRSTDEGATWADVGISITHPTSYIVECGLYLKNSNNALVYYARAQTGYLLASDITNFTTYTPGTLYNLMPAQNSTSDIKYIPATGLYVAVHNRISDGITGFSARKNLAWSISTDGATWVQQPQLIYTWNGTESCREPSILINPTGISVFFSRYTSAYDDVYKANISNTTISNSVLQ